MSSHYLWLARKLIEEMKQLLLPSNIFVSFHPTGILFYRVTLPLLAYHRDYTVASCRLRSFDKFN
jgi:hypothetical protein